MSRPEQALAFGRFLFVIIHKNQRRSLMTWGTFGVVHIITIIMTAVLNIALYFALKYCSQRTQWIVLGILSFAGMAAMPAKDKTPSTIHCVRGLQCLRAKYKAILSPSVMIIVMIWTTPNVPQVIKDLLWFV
jgi:hypothetical protein